ELVPDKDADLVEFERLGGAVGQPEDAPLATAELDDEAAAACVGVGLELGLNGADRLGGEGGLAVELRRRGFVPTEHHLTASCGTCDSSRRLSRRWAQPTVGRRASAAVVSSASIRMRRSRPSSR